MLRREIPLKRGGTLGIQTGDYLGNANGAYDQINSFCDSHQIEIGDKLLIDNTFYLDMRMGEDLLLEDVLSAIRQHSAKEKLIAYFCSKHQVELRQSQQSYFLHIDGHNYGVLNLSELTIATAVDFTKKHSLEEKKADHSTPIASDEPIVIGNWQQLYQTVKAPMASAAQSESDEKGLPAAVTFHDHPSIHFSGSRHRKNPLDASQNPDNVSAEKDRNSCPQFMKNFCRFL